MRISLCIPPFFNKDQWYTLVREAFPQADIALWEPGSLLANYALVWMPPQQFFDEQTHLKMIIVLGEGVDNLHQLALPQHIPVFRIEDAGMAQQMKEYVVHGVMKFFRRFDYYKHYQRTLQWVPEQQPQLQDYPIGIMGLGILGKPVAHALMDLGFQVHGWSRTPHRIEGMDCYHGDAEMTNFLTHCRILVCMLPLTDATQGILNKRTFSLMKKDGFLINVGRGHHLVEEDLLEVLASGQLAGALLDVFRREPLPINHPFWKHPAICITPHIAAHSVPHLSIEVIKQKVLAMEQGLLDLGKAVDLHSGY